MGVDRGKGVRACETGVTASDQRRGVTAAEPYSTAPEADRFDTEPVAVAPTSKGASEPGWVVIESYTGKVVAEYDTRQEAEDAAEWYQKTYGGTTLEVCRAAK